VVESGKYRAALAPGDSRGRRVGQVETPCAFVTLKPDARATEAEIIAFCRLHIAHFKAPRTVVFGPLPKTSTGKMQKFALRAQARALP